LGRIAGLADPTSWITDPQGNARLAGALWHSTATSFENDPAQFTSNVAGTLGTPFISGGDAAGGAGGAATAAEPATEASKAAAITGDVGKATTITQDAGKAAAITQQGASRAAAITQDASQVGVERGLEEAGKSGQAVAKSGETAATAEPAVALRVRGS